MSDLYTIRGMMQTFTLAIALTISIKNVFGQSADPKLKITQLTGDFYIYTTYNTYMLLNKIGIGLTRNQFDDIAEKHITGVVIVELFTRLDVGRFMLKKNRPSSWVTFPSGQYHRGPSF
jgi:hypothetical protein